ncbi:MAG: rhomboid family intramembrane serine protease [Paludibacteraceae bacterium]
MRNLPPVTRYLLLTNFIVWLLDAVLSRYGIRLSDIFGLHYFAASQYYLWQPFTYMFMHANFGHIFCNMFAVLMFAPVLENEWGSRKFLLYYLVCGVGAGLVQEAVWALMYQPTLNTMTVAYAARYINPLVTIGASGAVFGILFAFGWLFPNVPMYILFVPIPIRARVFVIIYAVIELMAGMGSMIGISGDNVAHFAHLGGMLFGWLLLLWWRHGDRWWRRLKQSFRSRFPRLDSAKDDHYSDYHYQRRV